MTARITLNPTRHREILAAMLNLGATVRRAGLEHSLILLIKTRVSHAGDYQPGSVRALREAVGQ